MRQLIDDHNFRPQVDNGLQVHFLQFLAFIKQFSARYHGQPFEQFLGFLALMRFNIADLHIDTGTKQRFGLKQHAVGLSHTGAHADIYLKLPTPRFFDQFEEVLYRFFVICVVHWFKL